MATATVTYELPTGGNALPAEINQDFTDLRTFINGSVVHKDGTNAMTGSLVLVGNPSSSLHAAPKQYVDAALPTTFSTWTPSIAQAGEPIDCTVSYGKYAQYKKTVFGWFLVTLTSAGATLGELSFTLPVDSSVGSEIFGPTIGAYKVTGGASNQGTVTLNPQGFSIGDHEARCTVNGSASDDIAVVASGYTLAVAVRYEGV